MILDANGDDVPGVAAHHRPPQRSLDGNPAMFRVRRIMRHDLDGEVGLMQGTERVKRAQRDKIIENYGMNIHGEMVDKRVMEKQCGSEQTLPVIQAGTSWGIQEARRRTRLRNTRTCRRFPDTIRVDGLKAGNQDDCIPQNCGQPRSVRKGSPAQARLANSR